MDNKSKIFHMLCMVLFLSLIQLTITGCDDGPDLERYNLREKLTIRSQFLTLSPDEIIFPVKVVIAIDMSLSMGDMIGDTRAGSDPYFLRMQAAQTFVDTYNTNDKVSFHIILWSNNIVDHTNGFTKDANELNAILSTTNIDTTTDYVGTVENISQVIQDDIRDTRSQDGGRETITRTKYIVLFLSDGIPNPGGSVIQDNNDIWDPIESLVGHTDDMSVGGFSFHTFLLAQGFAPTAAGQQFRQMAIETMEGMSLRGNGLFRELATVNDLNFVSTVDMRLVTEYKLKSVVAYNYSVIPGIDELLNDRDTDGIPDNTESPVTIEFSDYDQDGMSDFFERKMRNPDLPLDAENPNDSICGQSMSQDGIFYDIDKDGLNDCEEYILGTNRHLPDTDYDGFPDGIEFRMGTNPRDATINSDSDFDGVEDWREIQGHTNATANDPQIRRDFTYQVGTIDLGIPDHAVSATRLYELTVSNISLKDIDGFTQADGTVVRRDGDNLIRVYVSQIPINDLDAIPIYRMAEVVVNIEDGRELILEERDFELLE